MIFHQSLLDCFLEFSVLRWNICFNSVYHSFSDFFLSGNSSYLLFFFTLLQFLNDMFRNGFFSIPLSWNLVDFFFFFFSLKTYVSYQPWEIFLYYFADHFLFILFFCKCYWLDMNHLTLFPSPPPWGGINYANVFSNLSIGKNFSQLFLFFFPQSSFFLWYSFVRKIFEFMGAKSFDTSSLTFVKATFFSLIYLCVPCGRFSFSIFLFTKFFHYAEDFLHVLAHVSIQGGFTWRNKKNVNSVCMGIVCHLTGFILGTWVRSCHLCWRLIPLSIRMYKVFTMLVPSLY